jgi:hypothetical protein
LTVYGKKNVTVYGKKKRDENVKIKNAASSTCIIANFQHALGHSGRSVKLLGQLLICDPS